MRRCARSSVVASLGGAVPAAAQGAAAKGGKPVVTLTTSLGVIEVELDTEKAPISAKNFLDVRGRRATSTARSSTA